MTLDPEQLRHAMRATPYIFKGVIFGNNAAPTIGSEFNFFYHDVLIGISDLIDTLYVRCKSEI